MWTAGIDVKAVFPYLKTFRHIKFRFRLTKSNIHSPTHPHTQHTPPHTHRHTHTHHHTHTHTPHALESRCFIKRTSKRLRLHCRKGRFFIDQKNNPLHPS